jgi:hypothetical protein
MKHIIMYSGGIGSWATARTVINQHGPSDVTLLFADVGGDHTSPHVGEDQDCYRFIHETATQFTAQLVVLHSHETIWDVFERRRFLGNSRQSNCSAELKQKPCRRWLNTHCDPTNTSVYVGIDWTEMDRLPAIKHHYLPYHTEAPLTDPPYLDKREMLRQCRADGIKPPLMYVQGWPHANCQGACVKAGMAQWRKLLRERPDTYAYHEAAEQHLREHLHKDVSILVDRRSGQPVPITLRSFREHQQSGQLELFDAEDLNYEWGGCGCFTDYQEDTA